MGMLPPIFYEHKQGHEHGFEFHAPPPFSGITVQRSAYRPTLDVGEAWLVTALARKSSPEQLWEPVVGS
jgi:hypothetical protein